MTQSTHFPIGIFDSGVGGTSIWKEIVNILPNENTIYLADSKNAPYGEKSKDEIIQLSIKNTEFLLKQNCKIIVVACNTATTNAIKTLRQKYDIPFIGIEPAIKPAALSTKSNVVGILATKGTLNSELFESTSSLFKEKITIIETIGKGLVDLIETGKMNSPEMTILLASYLHPMLEQNVDCLVLGCTHYPYLIPQIRKIVGTKMQIIDSGLAVAKQTKAILEKNNLLQVNMQKGNHQLFSNSTIQVLEMLVGNQIAFTEIKKRDF
jgi:glutamate racemase